MAKCTLKLVLAFLLAVCLIVVPLLGVPQKISGLLTDDDLYVSDEIAEGQVLKFTLSADSSADAQTLAENAKKTAKTLKSRISSLGVSEADVNVISSKEVDVIVPFNEQGAALANTVQVIGKFEMKASSSEDAFITNDDLQGAFVAVDNSTSTSSSVKYSLILRFTDEGMKKLTETTTQIAGTTRYVYLYMDGESITSKSCSEAITENDVFFGGLEQSAAAWNAALINSGMLPQSVSYTTSSASAENPGAFGGMFIALAVCALLACAYLLFRFRAAGIAASLGVISALGLGMIFVSIFTLPISLKGIVCFVFIALCALLACFVLLENAAESKAAPFAAFKEAFSRKKFFIIDLVGLPLVISIAMIFYGNTVTALFSYMLFVSSVTTLAAIGVCALAVSALNDAGAERAFGN